MLVLVEFAADKGTAQGLLTPFGHLGIEVPDRADVDAMADRARAMGALHWEPRDVKGAQVGYVCAFKDPDGNVVEISHNQHVLASVHKLWG